MEIKRCIYSLDDDEISSLILKKKLEDAGYVCHQCSTSTQLFSLLDKIRSPGIFLLDVGLVGDELSGLEVCRRIKPLYNNPVVMLTGNRNTETVVDCMAVGADLYLEKPYDFEQLVAKIQAIARLYDNGYSASFQQASVPTPARSALTFSSSKRRFEHENGEYVHLTEKEAAFYQIIYNLDTKFVSREDAYLILYGRSMEPMNRAIDNLACRVRSKLKLLDCSVELQVVRGVGYKIVST
jgi:two-component system OmpR family response regulator